MNHQTSFHPLTREEELRTAFLNQVDLIPDGSKIRQCIQCGMCTASCPVSYAMDYSPRRMIALIRAGDLESVLRSNAIWMCASCYACTARCSVGIKITDLMYAFKRIAIEWKIYPKQFPVYALSSTFLDIVNRHGRNREVLLLLWYGLKTNPMKLLSSLPLALRLRRRGRIPLWPKGIANRKQLSRIIRQVLGKKNLTHKPAAA
jgi:heterodisulfide reductase subunit C